MKKCIDISSWQGNVDFAKLKASGYDVIALREGWGTKTVDGKFFEYVEGCRKAGIQIIGVYHFSYALNEAQAKQEAVSCISNLQKAGLGKDVLVFYDLEYDTLNYARKNGITIGKQKCTAHTQVFCETVSSYGYKAGIYANLDFIRNYYTKEIIDKYALWLAQWKNGGQPSYSCVIWQYSSKGLVNGIKGNVDMDWFYGETGQTSGTSGSATTQPATAKKSVDEIANEVIAGLWGNGTDRKNKLTNAGYNYSEVQKKVNQLVASASKPAQTKKTVDELAKEVIHGKWGNGVERKTRLTQAGYDYKAVQKRVNQMLS